MGHHARLRLAENALRYSMSKQAGDHLLGERGLLGNLSKRHLPARRDQGGNVKVDDCLLAQRVVVLPWYSG
jgi:hypothetical protein